MINENIDEELLQFKWGAFYFCLSRVYMMLRVIYFWGAISVILVAQTTGGCGPPPTKQAKTGRSQRRSQSDLFRGPSAE